MCKCMGIDLRPHHLKNETAGDETAAPGWIISNHRLSNSRKTRARRSSEHALSAHPLPVMRPLLSKMLASIVRFDRMHLR